MLPWRLKCTVLSLLDAVSGGSGALHEGGTGGGTRAGMTPALDKPIECPEKKLTELEGERKEGTKLVSGPQKRTLTFRIFLTTY